MDDKQTAYAMLAKYHDNPDGNHINEDDLCKDIVRLVIQARIEENQQYLDLTTRHTRNDLLRRIEYLESKLD